MKFSKLFSSNYSDGDVDTNRSDSPTLESLVEARYSRRQTLFGGMTATAAAVFGSLPLAACFDDGDSDPAPVVSAGGAVSTSSGRTVTLAGTATDNGTIASVQWTQISGPTVSVDNASTNTASFLAPPVAANTDLVFRFKARDGAGQETSANATVTVGPNQLGFTAVAKNLNDVVTVPAGYTISVLYRTGDPITAATAAFANDGTDTNYAARAGDHHDGIRYYGLSSVGASRDFNNNLRGLLVMNHENINQQYLHVGLPTPAPRPESEAIKEIECHGVSVVEVTRTSATGTWSYVQSGALNRRITPSTPTAFNGPVRGSDLLKTKFSPTGVAGRGTINNCAIGHTAWGTHITCEENWAGYFRRNTGTDNPVRTAKEVTALTRYGVTGADGNFFWSSVTPADPTNTLFARWNANISGATSADDFRNEPNQFGWVVEIDPFDPTSAPRKRTALGRMGHEGCWPGKMVAGRKPAWYMGDDSRNEYLYKFVSGTAWAEADAAPSSVFAIGDKYLDAGTLHVAKFNADGTGQWLPLVFGTGNVTAANPTYAFADQADVLTNVRLAADAQGATKMDRPEWTAVNPVSGEMYLTLTNNTDNATTGRPFGAQDAANPRFYNDPKGATAQRGNPNGHIIRLRETGDNTESLTFNWDIYLFAAGSDLDATNINISGLDATNDLSSPDGMTFGRATNAAGQFKPLLWIETDDSAYTDVTNCMMLAALPGNVGDGTTKTITNTSAAGATATQATRVGAAPGTNLRRFLVGPKESEITGIDSTPDGRTIFLNIQHPGELATNPAAPTSHWPTSQTVASPAAGVRPRSATIAITKDDGGVVGL